MTVWREGSLVESLLRESVGPLCWTREAVKRGIWQLYPYQLLSAVWLTLEQLQLTPLQVLYYEMLTGAEIFA